MSYNLECPFVTRADLAGMSMPPRVRAGGPFALSGAGRRGAASVDDRPVTHGLWSASATPALQSRPLSGDISCDTVVIGGGFTGCSAAYHLACEGSSVVLLEGSEIGFGASGRNVGLVNPGLWLMPDDLCTQLGAQQGERLLQQLGDAPGFVFDLIDTLGIDCEAERRGTLHCAAGQRGLQELQERARQWQNRGVEIILLDRQQAREKTGTSRYEGALFDGRAGTIQPLSYVRGLAHHAARQGAKVFTGTPALKFERHDGQWTIETPEGTVTARCVIVTTDAYSTDGADCLRAEQLLLPYFNVATRPLDPDQAADILPERQGAWDTRKILSSFRLDRAGRLVFGSVGALRRGGERIHTNWARREIARLFPQLGPVDFEHGWYGMIGMTRNALPRFHRLGQDVYSISGFNGRGIAPGTIFGRDLARLAMGQVEPEDLSLPLTELHTASFRGARSIFYELGSQAAHFVGARS